MRPPAVTLIATVILLVGGLVACRSTESSSPGARTQGPSAAAPPEQPNSGATATAYFPTGREAGSALRVDKDVPEEIRVGKSFTEKITVTNISSEELRGVTVRETLSPNFAPAKGSQAEIKNGQAHWNVGTLRPGESRTLEITGAAKNEGEVRQCTDVSYDTRLCTVRTATAPRMNLALSVPKEALACEPVLTRGTVRNTGSAPLSDVRVEGALPDGLVTEEGSRSSFTEEVGSLAPGESKDFTLKAKALRPGHYAGQAAATAADTRAESKWETVVREPRLEIKAPAPREGYVGTTIREEVVIKNVGDAPSPETRVEWTLPKDASFKGAEGGIASGDRASWDLGTIGPGESRRVAASFTSQNPGTGEAHISARGRCAKTSEALARTEFRGVPAVLLEATDNPDPAHVGEPVTYTITVTNQGSATLTNLQVSCVLEETMGFAHAGGPTPAQATADGHTDVTFAPLASLAPKDKAVWTVVVRPKSPADARFRVMLKTNETDRPLEKVESTHFISQ